MGVTGDFAALAHKADELRELAGALAEIAELARGRIQEIVDRALSAGVDPYGRPWAPTKDGSRPLAGLSVLVDVRGGTITATCSDPSSDYHQAGTGRMPQRMIVPDEGMGLPPEWQAVLEASAREVMAKAGAH